MNLKVKQFIDVYIGKVILLVNLIAVRSLGILLRRNHKLEVTPKNILVIKILGLGSVILASNALFSLKKKYPNAKLILLCGKGISAGITPMELFDEVWVIDDKNFLTLIKSATKYLYQTWGLRKLWVIDLEVYSILTTVFASWTCAINRFGFQLDKTNFRNYLNTHNVYFNQFIQVGINYQKLIEAAGVNEFIHFSFPEKFHSSTPKTTIAINNTCSDLGGDMRKMPNQLLADICNYVLQTTQYQIALVGAPSDAAENTAFMNRFNLNPERVINVAGKYRFEEYYHFLGSEVKCMLCIDSAPLHIAQKLNLPTFSLWGPTSPVQLLSQTNQTSYYYLNKACSPCIHHTEVIPCGGNNICMKDINIAQISPYIDAILK